MQIPLTLSGYIRFLHAVVSLGVRDWWRHFSSGWLRLVGPIGTSSIALYYVYYVLGGEVFEGEYSLWKIAALASLTWYGILLVVNLVFLAPAKQWLNARVQADLLTWNDVAIKIMRYPRTHRLHGLGIRLLNKKPKKFRRFKATLTHLEHNRVSRSEKLPHDLPFARDRKYFWGESEVAADDGKVIFILLNLTTYNGEKSAFVPEAGQPEERITFWSLDENRTDSGKIESDFGVLEISLIGFIGDYELQHKRIRYQAEFVGGDWELFEIGNNGYLTLAGRIRRLLLSFRRRHVPFAVNSS